MNIEKEKRAIEYLRLFEPKDEPYYLCYSGGKDSDAILILASLAGVNFEPKHNLTTVDSPVTVNYVKARIGVENIEHPDTTMWKLIVEKCMPPTRIIRYCCEELKEHGGKRRKKITGVRWAESANRKNNRGLVDIIGKEITMRRLAEEVGINYEANKYGGMVLNDDNAETRAFVDHCYRTTSVMVNPIVDWSDKDVWEFLYHYGCKSNPLYEASAENNTYKCRARCRVGCIACPMQGSKGMKADLIKHPKYRDNYLRAFKRMLEARAAKRLEIPAAWYSACAVMMWWVGDDPLTIKEMPEYLRGACL